jgi:hypothetical protein
MERAPFTSAYTLIEKPSGIFILSSGRAALSPDIAGVELDTAAVELEPAAVELSVDFGFWEQLARILPTISSREKKAVFDRNCDLFIICCLRVLMMIQLT